jgi:tRNA-dihydrouridine synthase B
MQIGPYRLSSSLILAPMAGVTDLPYRRLCRRFGAGMAVAEMSSSNPALRETRKTRLRNDHYGEPEPRVAQILGTDPREMAEAARFNAARGAQIVDINMGCPAKKVCNRAAGSALLRDEALVGRILDAVVASVAVPVTLKIRTGWDPSRRNAVAIAQLAERAGISAVSVHGRTRDCGFSGEAEYRTIRDVKQSVTIPVIANGDIDSPQKARRVAEITGADGLMIGRAALGRPWLFREIEAFLAGAQPPLPPGGGLLLDVIREHLAELYAFYGDDRGVRIGRKHVRWYLQQFAGIPATVVQKFNAQEDAAGQQAILADLVAHHMRESAA